MKDSVTFITKMQNHSIILFQNKTVSSIQSLFEKIYDNVDPATGLRHSRRLQLKIFVLIPTRFHFFEGLYNVSITLQIFFIKFFYFYISVLCINSTTFSYSKLISVYHYNICSISTTKGFFFQDVIKYISDTINL